MALDSPNPLSFVTDYILLCPTPDIVCSVSGEVETLRKRLIEDRGLGTKHLTYQNEIQEICEHATSLLKNRTQVIQLGGALAIENSVSLCVNEVTKRTT